LAIHSLVFCDTDRLVLGFDDFPPFTGADGSPRVAVDLLEEAMDRLGNRVDMIMVRSGNFERVFTDPRIEASPALWYSKERKRDLVFSKPFFHNRLLLVGRKGSGAAVKTLKDFDGATLGVVDGYAYGPELEKSGATLVLGVSDQKNMLKLLNGEVDFILIEEMLLTYARRVQREKFEALLEIGQEPLIIKPLHFAVKREVRGAKKLVRQLNRTLLEMLKDGTYHEIMGVGRLVADVDGDGATEVILVGDPAETLNPENVFESTTSTPDRDGKKEWYLVDGRLYASLDSIPPDKRRKMKSPAATANFEFQAL
jgi:polar amino acid transport system substrate-binding protein